MSSHYAGAVARIKSLLETAYPARIVTRDYIELADRPAAHLKAGVYTILCRGIEGYDYEVSDHFADTPAQTELGSFQLVITGQIKLPDKCTGEDIDSAEFDLIAELESFADSGITDPTLQDLLLRRTVMSQQLDKPYGWVFTEWRLRLFE
jgi:hypothetical protein